MKLAPSVKFQMSMVRIRDASLQVMLWQDNTFRFMQGIRSKLALVTGVLGKQPFT